MNTSNRITFLYFGFCVLAMMVAWLSWISGENQRVTNERLDLLNERMAEINK